ncbi:hypothetical protein G8S49_03185 [Clostridium botulinum C]|uniref:Uncharacterized protein n=3 Tax=Clostridium botulinum TaxID=1491 RepID=A0A9Q4TH80_CLOBO|nr:MULTISPECIES: hypothetical protein [Clostridium]AYF54610.1 hypothetical protein DFH04_07810 [Clostridium novyi]EES91821.1 hypothetical protein CLG_B0740 [Clostridium botulinum D str. 1873]KEI10200.1 hypothetical protein Z957_00270 [Clostridium sp. K25]MBO3442352.1 hypothetical protein [Clostridium haemolyticum]MCD3194545.1 hypothetical protein [Clostridium botulinum C]
MITNDKKIINNCICQSLNTPAPALTILNDGVYIAFCVLKFKVGAESFTEKSPKIFQGNSYRILYPSKAFDVDFNVYCYTSLTDYKVICSSKSHTPFTKCLILQGTIFNAGCKEYRCEVSNYYGCKCYCMINNI